MKNRSAERQEKEDTSKRRYTNQDWLKLKKVCYKVGLRVHLLNNRTMKGRASKGIVSLSKHLPDSYRMLFLAHELGHFLIAPLRRRFKTNFGIPFKKDRTKHSSNYWDQDDFRADIVANIVWRRLFNEPMTGEEFIHLSLCPAQRVWKAKNKERIINQIWEPNDTT